MIFPLSQAVIIKLLPVKSSLPAMITIARPTGKIKAPTSLPPTTLPIVAPTPARAIKMPAKMPSSNILPAVKLALVLPTSMVFLAISFGANTRTSISN